MLGNHRCEKKTKRSFRLAGLIDSREKKMDLEIGQGF